MIKAGKQAEVLRSLFATGGCAGGCLILILGIIMLPLLPFILPIFLLVMLWRSNWSMRAKRAITGALVYPIGAYFLWRYTRASREVRVGGIVAAVAATMLIVSMPVLVIPLVPVLMAAYLVLFLTSEPTELEPARVRATSHGARVLNSSPSASRSRPAALGDIPQRDLRLLLEIEEARNPDERRLLLAREFGRLAPVALLVTPGDISSWPSEKTLNRLRGEVQLLRSSAIDPVQHELNVDDPNDPLSTEALRRAISDLQNYVNRLSPADSTDDPDLEQVRRLARDKGRLQASYDEIVELLGTTPVTPRNEEEK